MGKGVKRQSPRKVGFERDMAHSAGFEPSRTNWHAITANMGAMHCFGGACECHLQNRLRTHEIQRLPYAGELCCPAQLADGEIHFRRIADAETV